MTPISTLSVSAGFTDNPRTRGFIDGTVVPRDVTLEVQAVDPGSLFARQLASADFDLSELSVSSLSIAIAKGDRTWIGLPVFTTRHFFHTMIIVPEQSDLHRPEDLRGKRVGVIEYQQTAVVWIRAILQRHFGVAPHEMRWVMERRPEHSHGGKTGFVPPPGIELTYVDETASLASLLEDGQIDAILFYPEPEPGSMDDRPDRGRARLHARSLFADVAEEERRFLADTGILPLNHGVVLRRTLAEAHPWLGREIFETLVAARNLVSDQRSFPYGVAANRPALEMLLDSIYDQGLSPRRVALQEIFIEP